MGISLLLTLYDTRAVGTTVILGKTFTVYIEMQKIGLFFAISIGRFQNRIFKSIDSFVMFIMIAQLYRFFSTKIMPCMFSSCFVTESDFV